MGILFSKDVGDLSADGARLARDLLESDVHYFRAAACQERIGGYELLHMAGLTSLAAGCVALTSGADSPGPVQALEQRFRELGCRHARVYQQHLDDELEKMFVANGFRRAEEIGMLRIFADVCSPHAVSGRVHLRTVRSERDWSLKLSLHRDVRRGPDGHSVDADQWVQMERLKCEAGYMEAYLIHLDDQPCGAVNFSPSARLGRLKNLVVHPHWRRRGIGVEAAREIIRLASQRGLAAAGVFALEHGPSLKLYRDAGYLPVVRQVEWYRRLQ